MCWTKVSLFEVAGLLGDGARNFYMGGARGELGLEASVGLGLLYITCNENQIEHSLTALSLSINQLRWQTSI